MLCGHVFHTECINNYCVLGNKTRHTCCPYKCHASTIDVTFEEDVEQPATPTTNAAPVQASATAEEMAAASAEMTAALEGLT